MANTTLAVPAAPTTNSPKPTGSARPPTPVNPPVAAQKGPTAPASSAAPTTKAAPAAPVTPATAEPPATPALSMKEQLKALYHPEAKPADAAPVEPKVAEPATKEPVAAEPVKVAEPVAKADPFADITAPENLSENGKKGWDALKTKARTEIDAAHAALETAKAELATFRNATPAEQADVAALQARAKAAEDRLAVLDLQSHPDFTRQYVEPQTKAIAEAKQLLGDSGKTDVDMGRLLALPRADFAKEVSELAAKMPAFDQQTFVQSMRDAYRLGGEAKVALAKAGELKTGIEQKTAAEQKQAFEATWGKFGGAEHFLKAVEIPDKASAEDKAELSAYNQAVATVRGNAERNAFGRVDAGTAAQIASKAAILDFVVGTAIPRMNKEHSRIVAEHGVMLAELQAIKGAKNPGSFTAPSTTEAAPKTAKDYLNLAFGKK